MNTRNLIVKVVVAAFALSIAACQTTGIKESKTSVQLPPMPRPIPERHVGYRWKGLKNGKPHSYTLVAKTADTIQWGMNNGCSWTTSRMSFSPTLEWRNCPGELDGTQTIRGTGAAWPLTVGKEWSFTFAGVNETGGTWDGERQCKVAGTAAITTRLGKHDTYKIVCETPWLTRTWYVSPRLKTVVYSIHDFESRGYSHVYETLERIPGSTLESSKTETKKIAAAKPPSPGSIIKIAADRESIKDAISDYYFNGGYSNDLLDHEHDEFYGMQMDRITGITVQNIMRNEIDVSAEYSASSIAQGGSLGLRRKTRFRLRKKGGSFTVVKMWDAKAI